MKTYSKTINSPRLVITYDTSPESPRMDTNLGYFITKDSNYRSPDEEPHMESIVAEMGDIANSQEEHMDLIEKTLSDEGEKVLAIYPITKYEHGGVVYKLGSQQGWDYSNNGFYIVTEKSQKETGVDRKDFETVIRAELDIYNHYVNGEIYRFELYNETGKLEDSCGCFYDIEDIKDYLPADWKDEVMSEYFVEKQWTV